jgi:hypothetical protein
LFSRPQFQTKKKGQRDSIITANFQNNCVDDFFTENFLRKLFQLSVFKFSRELKSPASLPIMSDFTDDEGQVITLIG